MTSRFTRKLFWLCVLGASVALAAHQPVVTVVTRGHPNHTLRELQNALKKDVLLPGWSTHARRWVRYRLASLGYVNSQFDMVHKGQRWSVHVKTLGPPVRWRHVHVVWDEAVPSQAAHEAVLAQRWQPGTRFNADVYTDRLAAMRQALHRLGFVMAQVHPKVALVRPANVADAWLTVQPGPCYTWGQVRWEATSLDASVRRRLWSETPGAQFDPAQVARWHARLLRSGYFSDVTLVPHYQHDNHQVDIVVQAHDAKQWSRSIGIGYDTDQGMQAIAEAAWPRLNPQGHRLQSQLSLGTRESSALIRYVVPGSDPLQDQWVLNAQVQTNHEGGLGASTFWGMGLEYLMKRDRWDAAWGLQSLFERSKPLRQRIYHSALLYPEGRATWYWPKRSATPSWGSLTWSGRGAGRGWASNTTFLQQELAGGWHQRLGGRGSWVVRGKVGRTWGRLADVPLSLQYATGGTHSVRGYGYHAIGPGVWLKEVQCSWFYRVHGSWYAGPFVDMGRASNRWRASMYRGVGLSTVWVSQMGGVEISLARALDGEHPGWRLHLSVHPRRWYVPEAVPEDDVA